MIKHNHTHECRPVYYKNTRYNCRVIFYNGRVLLIRPKLHLANSGNYRESRWFSCWMRRQEIETYPLSRRIQEITGQTSVPIGDAFIKTIDTSIGCEVCEELFTADSPHNSLGLDGVEIFSNGSASHYQAGKLARRLELVNGATARAGGIYLYANQHGIDGEGKVYYDGSALISSNGNLIAQGKQFPLEDVHVVVSTIDIDDLRVFRGLTQSLGNQGAALTKAYPQINLFVSISEERLLGGNEEPIEATVMSNEEELARCSAAWLWSYLRKAGAGGFFLALSGGADSAATAMTVYSLADMLFNTGHDSEEIASQIKEVTGLSMHQIQSPSDLMKGLLHTAYISTEHSSEDTRSRSLELAKLLGATYTSFPMDSVVSGCVKLISAALSYLPRFASEGGTRQESIALQNLQARLRMVLTYFCAQLIPVVEGKERPLLVLGTANLDEGLRGYFTKYDNSSGDLNPIGSVCKEDLRSFLRHMHDKYPHLQAILADILGATPTAELEPGNKQEDEIDMGMTYHELSIFGSLRGKLKAGPYTMFSKLAPLWSRPPFNLSLSQVAEKVKFFFRSYAMNRHKLQTITPALHGRSDNIDDHRYDQRPYLYRVGWPWQFRKIDEAINNDQMHE